MSNKRNRRSKEKKSSSSFDSFFCTTCASLKGNFIHSVGIDIHFFTSMYLFILNLWIWWKMRLKWNKKEYNFFLLFKRNHRFYVKDCENDFKDFFFSSSFHWKTFILFIKKQFSILRMNISDSRILRIRINKLKSKFEKIFF